MNLKITKYKNYEKLDNESIIKKISTSDLTIGSGGVNLIERISLEAS